MTTDKGRYKKQGAGHVKYIDCNISSLADCEQRLKELEFLVVLMRGKILNLLLQPPESQKISINTMRVFRRNLRAVRKLSKGLMSYFIGSFGLSSREKVEEEKSNDETN